jgi:glyoxylase-like metal-dependent hydrolase (beta-lactamase superfamily II)
MSSFTVISIGTLAANPLWDERADVRTGHATTVLVEAGDVRLVVNPSLPAQALAARMGERTRVRPQEITDVFITCFLPDHRRAVELFPNARLWMAENEMEAAGPMLRHRLEEAEDGGDDELATLFQRDVEQLARFSPAPDRVAPGIDLFPLPGVTPGNCGLLLPQPGRTVLITGDAVATIEHLHKGQVLPTCVDVETAQESLREAIEIADVVVPGRDNVTWNPLRAVGG